MKISKSYTLAEFLDWTRRKIYILLVLALVPVLLYQVLGQKWAAAPWPVAVLLGTATSFIVGFRNAQTYTRTLEAQQVWAAIVCSSRYWGLISRDFPTTRAASMTLVRNHLAWLTALRYHLRGPRAWETAGSPSNAEYKGRFYSVPEHQTPLETALRPYLPADTWQQLALVKNKPTFLLSRQSEALRALYAKQELVVLHHTEMQKTLKDMLDQQAKVERIKNFPYPRQHASINTFFVWCFAAVLPFCMVREFDRLNDGVTGVFAGHMAWLTVPFSLLVAWMFISLDQVGESTENPFEGSANDVPISQICRVIEVELMQILGAPDAPPLLQPQNHIIL